ncbi:hypothetical protein UlMin_027401 [Ulmus minor]
MNCYFFKNPLPSPILVILAIVVLFVNNSTNDAITIRAANNDQKRKVSAVFTFGDSILDTDNNNNYIVNTIFKCNFPPYGRDFVGGNPTGRFSNSSNLQLQELLTGVSFASGGAGYDPLTNQLVSVLSFSDQLEMFKNYTAKIKAGIGETRAMSLISESIFIISGGSNDIANTYFTSPYRRFLYELPSYTDLMVNYFSNFLQGQGCVPEQRTEGGSLIRSCADNANNAATLFNSKLSSQITSLNQRFPDARLVYIDTYNPLLDLVQNPTRYGFEVADVGCCGTGNIEVSILCNNLTPSTCTNASIYLFWDSFRPTEQGYRVFGCLVLSKNINNFF